MIRRLVTPHLSWSLAIQVLVRADMVVPEAEFGQRTGKLLAVFDQETVDALFEGAEESFDASVAPRA